MKFVGLAAASFAAAMIVNVASAGEMADACVAKLEAEGRDTSGCACLEEKTAGDQALIDELTTLGEIADPAERYAAASDKAKAVMDACTRKKAE